MGDDSDGGGAESYRLQPSPVQLNDGRNPMRKQKAISVTLTSDCLNTTHLNEICIPAAKVPANINQEQPQLQLRCRRRLEQPVVASGDGDSDIVAVTNRHHVTSPAEYTQLASDQQQQPTRGSADSMRQKTYSANNNNLGASSSATVASKLEQQQNRASPAARQSINAGAAAATKNHQIPNLFFSKLQTIEDQESFDGYANAIPRAPTTGQANRQQHFAFVSPAPSPAPNRRNTHIISTSNPTNQNAFYYVTAASSNSAPIGGIQNVQQQHQGANLMTMILNDSSTLLGPQSASPQRSIASSPRVARRGNATAADQLPPQMVFVSNVSGNANPTGGLAVSPALGRKLSLQPMGQQQPQPSIQQYILLDKNNQYQQVTGLCPNGLLNPNSMLNCNAIPRKSLIGRLERSSFQAQRLSDVGVAFGQQITAKIGLKLPASQERIVEQTRWLYLRYVFVKLRQNKLPLRDLNLTKSSRARRAAALGTLTLGATGPFGSSSNTPNSTGPANSPATFLTNHRTPASVSLSAPASASVSNFDNLRHPQTQPSPFADLTNVEESSRPNRSKRVAVGEDLDSQQISMLAAKMQSLSKRSNDRVSPLTAELGPASQQPTQARHPQLATPNAPLRKYIMDPTINNQVFSVILNINRELHDSKPEFYGDTIYELIGIDKFASLETLLEAQMTICQEMTRSDISWCRITALFSLFGAMSLDCVRLGTPEHVGPILDGFIEFVERDLALWISQQGGWESFLYKYRAGFRFGPTISKALALAVPLFIWVLMFLSKW